MFATAELRWFYQGILPNEMIKWFQSGGAGEELKAPEEREDLYLYAAGYEYLNIKLREERLEVKWRQAELGELSFRNAGKGKAEKWLKWICGSPPAQSLIATIPIETREWVRVKKSRTQRQFQVLSDESIISVPVDADINQGCTVELTQLIVKGEAWWSLAFEAFGEDENLIATLHKVVEWVAKSYSGLSVQAASSSGYPKWLSMTVNR
ncbi:hypothetical protein [Microcoleus sp. FACHB-672]|uniref:hypothetical protein n=1 Tax=Microcoleus sp. FACHB-672 TaxID=2692825 RepID=UPI001689D68D|nr:hypothetical protein [Microcoleus sp. FACHB-672]MBD2044004.1 hypothetical protein [Microcoleus sp. FACHB-672]